MPESLPVDEWSTLGREFGIRLQRLRLQAAYTQEQVAYAAGLTRSHYQQLERGQSGPGRPANPSLQTLLSLAAVFGVPPADLIPEVSPTLRRGVS